MVESSNNKTIARNTVFLYFRMMFTMVVSLFTSRVILQALGVEDYGIYQTVGGVVAMLSFINGALSTGSSRFLTFELGTGDFRKLKRTFSSVLTIHIALSVIVVLLAETIGLWFVYNKLVIPPERLNAAVITYHASIISVVFSITQVPYNASIISHEKMSIYAYASIIEVVLKLAIAYCVVFTKFDNLIVYAFLLCVVHIGMTLYYRWYCVRHFVETRFEFYYEKGIIKQVLGYSGWNMFANMAIALNNQGATILINIFFNPSIVAARAIANQVNMAANQFINNFRTAVNPQIVKRFAAKDYDGSKLLLLRSTEFSYYLMLLLALPICLCAENILSIWLVDVPQYAESFLQLTILASLFHVFDASFYTALYAKGQIKENAMISPTVLFVSFPIVYLMYKCGMSPLAISYAQLVSYAILGLVVKPYLIIKIVGYTKKDILSVFAPCLKVTIIGSAIPCLLYYCKIVCGIDSALYVLFLIFASVVSVALAAYYFGLDKQMRAKLLLIVRKKIKK